MFCLFLKDFKVIHLKVIVHGSVHILSNPYLLRMTVNLILSQKIFFKTPFFPFLEIAIVVDKLK
jgi:hypothetical protein